MDENTHHEDELAANGWTWRQAGHGSIKIAERHYTPWVRARQEQMEADIERRWGRDPLLLAQAKGAPEVHKNREAVN